MCEGNLRTEYILLNQDLSIHEIEPGKIYNYLGVKEGNVKCNIKPKSGLKENNTKECT